MLGNTDTDPKPKRLECYRFKFICCQ